MRNDYHREQLIAMTQVIIAALVLVVVGCAWFYFGAHIIIWMGVKSPVIVCMLCGLLLLLFILLLFVITLCLTADRRPSKTDIGAHRSDDVQ